MFIIRSPRFLTRSLYLPLNCLSSSTLGRCAFGSSKWNKTQLLRKLDKQIIDSHAQIVWEDRQTEVYFKRLQWHIRYIQEKTQFQYSKTKGDHEVRVLTHVMYAPPNDPDHVEQEKDALNDLKEQQRREKYSQVGIFIRRKGENKWLTAEVAVREGSIELVGLFFTQNPDFSWQKGTYPGPEIKTLPVELMDAINQFLQGLGLTSEVIMNMVIHASIKVDPLDLEWLKNLRQIWT